MRFLQTEYRNVFAHGETTCLESDQKLNKSGMRLRIAGLTASPFFEGVSVPRLIQMASNLSEVELRQGDEFVRVGQEIDACYLVLEGFVKVYVPAARRNKIGAQFLGLTE